jgi:hypothetical protein
MHKRLFLFIILLILSAVIQAQGSRDYAILDISYVVSEDQSQLILNVTVTNLGAAATTNAPVVVKLEGETLTSQLIAPLAAAETRPIEIPLSANDFPADGTQVLEVSVGIDPFELANTPIAANNIDEISVSIQTVESTPELFAIRGDEFVILGYVFTRTDAAIYLVSFVLTVIVLWLLTVVLRLIFRRPARFGTWQPPYGMMPMYDQNSVEGRRQAWQTLAQNSLLLASPTDGNLHPVKMLIGTDGGNLHNWKISAIRLSQYDSYGRISRSQAVADKKWVKRLNNVLKKRYTQNEEKVQKLLRPIAQGLVQQFRKRVNKKNGFLPIALDIRMDGKHGEVRIVFELYQCQGRAWYRLDQWEPTMMVVAQSMQENFTFTIHGSMSNEKPNEFYERLRDDIIWLLLEMVRVDEMTAQAQPQPQQRREAFDVPDTLSGMQPIHDDSQPVPSNA